MILVVATWLLMAGMAAGQEPPAEPAAEAERREEGPERRRDEIETDRDSFTPSVWTVSPADWPLTAAVYGPGGRPSMV